MQVKSAGTWKTATPYVKDAGVWKEAKEVWVKNAGVWVKAWSGALTGVATHTMNCIALNPHFGMEGNNPDGQWGVYYQRDPSIDYFAQGGSLTPTSDILGAPVCGISVNRNNGTYVGVLYVTVVNAGTAFRNITQLLIGPYTFTGIWTNTTDLKTGALTGRTNFGNVDDPVIPGSGNYRFNLTVEQENVLINLMKAGPVPIAWR